MLPKSHNNCFKIFAHATRFHDCDHRLRNRQAPLAGDILPAPRPPVTFLRLWKIPPAYRGARGQAGGGCTPGCRSLATLTITPWHRRSHGCIAQIVKGLFGCAKQCIWKAGRTVLTVEAVRAAPKPRQRAGRDQRGDAMGERKREKIVQLILAN